MLEANKVFAQAAKDFGLPLLSFSLPTTYWMRSFIFLFGFPITHDVATNKKNRETFQASGSCGGRTRMGEYRTAPAFQDAVMDTYSFNNHALRRFHETVKDAVDPNGIISAGPLRDLAQASAGEQSMKALIVSRLCVAGCAFGADEATIQKGEKVYDYWCATCHGPGTCPARSPYRPSTKAPNRPC